MKYLIIIALFIIGPMASAEEKIEFKSFESEIILFQSKFEDASLILSKFNVPGDVERHCLTQIYNAVLRIGLFLEKTGKTKDFVVADSVRILAVSLMEKHYNSLVKLGSDDNLNKIVDTTFKLLIRDSK